MTLNFFIQKHQNRLKNDYIFDMTIMDLKFYSQLKRQLSQINLTG